MKINSRAIALLSLFTAMVFAGNVSYSRIGVGVGTGKIQVDDKLKPGTIYRLPSLVVLNTGDEESEYEVGIAYHEQQSQIKPPKEWFSFSPDKFNLKPGEGKNVDIKLNIPVKTVPGDYFAYVEAFPAKKSTTQSGASVGVAAATKLYFTIVPANYFQGIYYRIVSFWNINQPWSGRVATGIAAVLALIIFKKFFRIELNLKNPKKETGSTDKTNE
jgi:hypothetical protein